MNWIEQHQNLAYTASVMMLVGYGLFLIMRMMLPKKLKSEQIGQRDLVIKKAHIRKNKIIQEAIASQQQQLDLKIEVAEEQLEDAKQSAESIEQELSSQEDFAQKESARIGRIQKQVDLQKSKLVSIQTEYEKIKASLQESTQLLQLGLSQAADCDLPKIRTNISEEIVSEYRLESQKRIKTFIEELQNQSKKMASRSLSRVLARYEPEFIWPKPTSHVEIENPRIVDQLRENDQHILTDLAKLTDGVEISLVQEKETQIPAVRFGGGYGIHKEAARLALEELIKKGWQWNKLEATYQKYVTDLNRQALTLGKRATRELGLTGIHPEIQTMVGALNWRTSYRQNQYFHSLEVAKLAGIIANEIGVDPDLAKRCGLLHDIGKGIDYRIEGSHAVISGDYADRYGENKIVCDTVMSHHNDLVLETPLSYVLKSADTLSGARPGARVNLEEGYQIRLSAIEEVVRSFNGITKIAIMNGGREVHVEVNHKKVKEDRLESFTNEIARKIEEHVAYPGQIKVLVTRRFESVAVA